MCIRSRKSFPGYPGSSLQAVSCEWFSYLSLWLDLFFPSSNEVRVQDYLEEQCFFTALWRQMHVSWMRACLRSLLELWTLYPEITVYPAQCLLPPGHHCILCPASAKRKMVSKGWLIKLCLTTVLTLAGKGQGVLISCEWLSWQIWRWAIHSREQQWLPWWGARGEVKGCKLSR